MTATSSRPSFFTDALTALSLANLLYFPVWTKLVGEPARFLRRAAPANVFYLVAIGEVVLIAAVMFAAARMAREVPKFMTFFVRPAFIACFLVALNGIRKMFPALDAVEIPNIGTYLRLLILGFGVLGLMVASRTTAVVRGIRSVVLILSPIFLVMLFQVISNARTGAVLYDAVLYDNLQTTSAKAADSPQPQKRLLWLMFDELDDGLVFPQRIDSLRLPALDVFSKEALRFSATLPSSPETMNAVPSMLTGLNVSNHKRLGAEDLELELAGGSHLMFRSVPTLFSKLADSGLNVGVVGWALPYCRLFDSLARCEWEEGQVGGNLSLDAPIPIVAWQWLVEIVKSAPFSQRFIPYLIPNGYSYIRSKHLASYRRTLENALDTVNDRGLHLVYVHWPIPHLPGIYDRRSEQPNVEATSLHYWDFTNGGIASPEIVDDYWNNLALVDQTLSHLRDAMQINGVWDETTVIVSGDHGWRDGKNVGRPLLMVKFSGKHNSALYDEPFFMGNMMDLVLGFSEDRFATYQDVMKWADGRRLNPQLLSGAPIANVTPAATRPR